ncbi:MAG: hypothetical protein V4739_01200 [Pseudomonadota bacterium]
MTRTRTASGLTPWLALAAVCSTLSACYVVPIDPRTGQGYLLQGPHSAHGREAGPNPGAAALPSAAPSGPAQARTLSTRLYPLNAPANQGGLLTANVLDNHSGRGSFTLSYRGDTMQGEAARVDSSYAAFGRVYNEVLGASARSYSGQRGIANAYGAKGVSVQCEYLLQGPGTGTGVCLFSDGAKYQMHFGG